MVGWVRERRELLLLLTLAGESRDKMLSVTLQTLLSGEPDCACHQPQGEWYQQCPEHCPQLRRHDTVAIDHYQLHHCGLCLFQGKALSEAHLHQL